MNIRKPGIYNMMDVKTLAENLPLERSTSGEEAEIVLPDKLSELFTLALDDAEGLDREEYEASARHWHEREKGIGRCGVCLAGFVAVRSLGMDIDSSGGTENYSDEIQCKLMALDVARKGNLTVALEFTGQLKCPMTFSEHKERAVRFSALNESVEVSNMKVHSEFENWCEFEDFSYFARRVVTLLKSYGY